MSRIAALAALVSVVLFLAGCDEKKPAASPLIINAASAETRVKCARCGAVFPLGDAARPNPHAPQAICPVCGKAMIPTPAAN